MIKFTASKVNGGTLIGFGLTPENIWLLKAGKPIHVFMAEVLPNSKDEILIFYVQSVDKIKADFLKAGLISKETKVEDKIGNKEA